MPAAVKAFFPDAMAKLCTGLLFRPTFSTRNQDASDSMREFAHTKPANQRYWQFGSQTRATLLHLNANFSCPAQTAIPLTADLQYFGTEGST